MPPLTEFVRDPTAFNRLPLHAKPVARTIDRKRLSDLAHKCQLGPAWDAASAFLTNTSIYENMAPPQRAGCGRCSLLDNDIVLLQKVQKIVPIDSRDARGYCNTFCRVEAHKNRRRWIVEPLLNDNIADETAATALSSRADVRRHAASPDSAIAQTEDFASFYDQFELDPAVRPYYCFVDRHGRCWALTVLPMGCRISCRIAQLASTVLARTAIAQVGKPLAYDVYIDNVEFLGATDAVAAVAVRYHAICADVGAVLNDTDGLQLDYEFIGEAFDLRMRTRRLAKHPKEKVEAAIKAFQAYGCPTPRRLAAFVGLLLFASEVLALNVAAHFRLLWVYRQLARRIGLGEISWNSPLPPLYPSVADDLYAWLLDALDNRPVPAVDDRAPTLYMMTDASVHGYGAVVWGDTVRTIAKEWTANSMSRRPSWQSRLRLGKL